jgi:uncharacterized membrane protein YphA (DoxX/SURF4 family)
MKLEAAGAKTFSLGLLLLGAVSAASGKFVPGLQLAPGAFEMPDTLAHLNGILLVALSVLIVLKRHRRPAAAAFAAYLSAWLLIHIWQLLAEPFEIMRLVSLMEVAAIVAALQILSSDQGSRSSAPVRLGSIVYGCMLLLFAAVHFQYHDFIASMIPVWIPFAMLWPWFTATANLAAGLSFITGFKTPIGGALLGAMYASSVPIVHLPRVLAAPGNAQEWTAGALAVTLAGAAWLVAGSGRGRATDPATSLAGLIRRFVMQFNEERSMG